MNKNLQTIGDRIKALCESRGVTLQNLSFDARVSYTVLWNWTNNQVERPDPNALARVAAALDTTTDYLITGHAPLAAAANQ